MKKINFKEIELGNDKIGIGINSEQNYTIFIPKYVLTINEMNKITINTKEKIKKLFKAWEIYQKRNSTELGGDFSKDDVLYDLNNSLDIIKDFVEHGLYIEQEDAEKFTQTGKMNFKKTINSCNPLYTQQGPIYLKYISDTKKQNDQNFIRLIQTTIINEISQDFGWMIGFNFKLPVDRKIQLNSQTQQILNQKLNQSFNTRKINLIKLLIKYINNKSKGIKEGKKLFVGMANLFWEDLIDYVVGNTSKKDLKKYFYVNHAYVNGGKTNILHPLMPDSVYKDDKNIIIIDSKYYINNNLPDNNDLNKQFIYLLKAYQKFNKYDNFGNCFILPTDKTSYTSNEIAKFDLEVENENLSIKLIYANVNEMINYYINGEKNHGLINDLIITN